MDVSRSPIQQKNSLTQLTDFVYILFIIACGNY